jgi:extradiol dioxygenase family protein
VSYGHQISAHLEGDDEQIHEGRGLVEDESD